MGQLADILCAGATKLSKAAQWLLHSMRQSTGWQAIAQVNATEIRL